MSKSGSWTTDRVPYATTRVSYVGDLLELSGRSSCDRKSFTLCPGRSLSRVSVSTLVWVRVLEGKVPVDRSCVEPFTVGQTLGRDNTGLRPILLSFSSPLTVPPSSFKVLISADPVPTPISV